MKKMTKKQRIQRIGELRKVVAEKWAKRDLLQKSIEQHQLNALGVETFAEVLSGLIYGASFATFRSYTNERGEIANHTVNLNMKYGRAKLLDLKKLEGMQPDLFKQVAETHGVSLTVLGFSEIQGSLNGTSEKSRVYSDAQKDAYIPLGKGFKIHRQTGHIYLNTFFISKTVLVEGEPKAPVKHRPLTACKNLIKRRLAFQSEKYMNYRFDRFKSIRLVGKELIIE